MQIINPSERAVTFPHLLPTDNKEVHLPRGVTSEKRKELLNSKNICRRCLKPAEDYWSCSSFYNKRKNNQSYFCNDCNCHNTIGDCISEETRTKNTLNFQ